MINYLWSPGHLIRRKTYLSYELSCKPVQTTSLYDFFSRKCSTECTIITVVVTFDWLLTGMPWSGLMQNRWLDLLDSPVTLDLLWNAVQAVTWTHNRERAPWWAPSPAFHGWYCPTSFRYDRHVVSVLTSGGCVDWSLISMNLVCLILLWLVSLVISYCATLLNLKVSFGIHPSSLSRCGLTLA